MSRDTCHRSTCTNPVGEADDGQYDDRRFCSAMCEVKHEHIKADAADARRSEEKPHDERPRHDRGGRYV